MAVATTLAEEVTISEADMTLVEVENTTSDAVTSVE